MPILKNTEVAPNFTLTINQNLYIGLHDLQPLQSLLLFLLPL